MDLSRERHWQRSWASRSLATARWLPGQEKFFALVAYPGSSGFLHLGHLRGWMYADAAHRYHRAMGHATFFPTGTHASGLPSVTFAQKVARRDPATVAQLEQNEVPRSEWPRLTDPVEAARFLGRTYVEVGRQLGLLVDERAYLTTVDDDYQKFIGWQFRRLKEHGALVQAPHFASVCPVCGPVSVDPSETDLSSGGDADWVDYRTVPFRLEDGRIMLAATLRPETVYGVTNLWVHPTETLTVWHHGEDVYLVHRNGGEWLVEQHGGRLGHEISVVEVLGRSVTVPITGRAVPVLASALVDPKIGTGVVMSVPSHAPADWLGVAALGPSERAAIGDPPIIVELPDSSALSPSEKVLLAGEGAPAERALRATGARQLSDTQALEEATERLYRVEFVRGRMRRDLLDGRPVAEARELVSATLRESHHGLDLQTFSKPVVCRNGHDVVIRRVPDQWFIHYGDPAWKQRTRDAVQRMSFYPPEYGQEFPGILDWFSDRPCTRRGRWLGTPFPLDPSWIIEPIADSTFYPAYFVVRPYVTSGRLAVSGLTDAFFDLVFLGRGTGEPSVAADLQKEIRDAFTFWYPLDVNFGGKEHKRVHFPVFLYTHALLLAPELQPRAVFVNWWLTLTGGEKVSKRHIGSKGGAIPPLRDALQRWGADALRLFYAEAASPYQDIEWDPGLVDTAQARLADIERIARELAGEGAGGPPELERWLSSEVHDLVQRYHAAFRGLQFREAAEIVYVSIPARLRRYIVRGGDRGVAVDRVVSAWIRLMAPITPHLAEELGEGRFDSLVAEQALPKADEFEYSESALAIERYLEVVEDDLRSVLKPAQARGEKPSSVVFFVAAPWKAEVEGWMREATETKDGRPLVRSVMERAKGHPELSSALPQIPKFVERVGPLLRSESPRTGPSVDEMAALRAAEGYFVRRFEFTSVIVVREAEAAVHDPMGRRDRARAGRPAFYLGRVAYPTGEPSRGPP
jgi:leucyl-tRNA synthetase